MRYDRRRKIGVLWLTAIVILGLVGWLLRGLACPLPLVLSGWLSQSQIDNIVRACWRAGTITHIIVIVMALVPIVVWGFLHRLDKGPKYAFRHTRMVGNIRQALLEAGFGIPVGDQYVKLPRVKVYFDDDNLTFGVVRIRNHIVNENNLRTINLSSALGPYVVDARYITNDNNYFTFIISDSRLDQQLAFSSYKELTTFVERHTQKYGQGTLFLDERNQGIKARSMLLVGITGAGKSYALMNLIAQLKSWRIPPVVYYADLKGSDIAVLGGALAPERTSDEVDAIIDLLRKFLADMMKRKAEMKHKLRFRLGVDYTAWDLPAHIFIFDEFAVFHASINRDKKRRDEVEELLRQVVLMGRQLGFFMWITMQKSDSTDIPTSIRDNLPWKVCLGNAPSTTLLTIFGHSADLPDRYYEAGQGLMYCDGVTRAPRPASFAKLNFDIFGELTGLSNHSNDPSGACERAERGSVGPP